MINISKTPPPSPKPERQFIATISKPLSVQETENALAKATIHKGHAVSKIKHLQERRKEKDSTLRPSELKQIKKAPYIPARTYPYTQTEAHLKLLLGKDYIECPLQLVFTSKDPEEIRKALEHPETQKQYKGWLEGLIRKALEKGNVHKKTSQLDDYVTQMIEAAFKERVYIDKIIFYHGTDERIGFLYDVFTELRKQLMISDNIDTVFMRSIDKAFEGILNVMAFIEKFEDPRSKEVFNYDPGYIDLAISANPFLFGSFGNGFGETFRYFLKSHSEQPIALDSLLGQFFGVLGIPQENIQDFLTLFKTIEQKETQKNGRLWQLIIDPNTANSMAYTSITLGNPICIHGSPYHASEVFCATKEDPDSLTKALSNAYLAKMPNAKGNEDYNELEIRVFLKPDEDPNKVMTRNYWRVDLNRNDYNQALKKLVAQTLAAWLPLKAKIPSGTFYSEEATQKLQKLYQYVYEGEMGGKKYVSKDIANKMLLLRAMNQDSIQFFEEFYKEYGETLFDQQILEFASSEKELHTISILQFLHQNKCYKIIEYCLRNRLITEAVLTKNKLTYSDLLSLGCEKGSLVIVEIVLKYIADIHLPAKGPDNELITSAELAFEKGHARVLGALLDKGATLTYDSKEFQKTFLNHFKENFELIKVLVEHGFDIKTFFQKWQEETFRESLSDAKYSNNLAAYSNNIQLLIESGFQFSCSKKMYLSAFSISNFYEIGGFPLIKLLIEKGLDSKLNEILLKDCLETGDPELFGFLLDQGYSFKDVKFNGGITPLMEVIRKNYTALALKMIERSLDIDGKNKFGCNALHYVIGFKVSNGLEIAQALIKARIDINAQEEDGASPLITAVAIGNIEMVQLLIQSKADKNIVDAKGKRALDYARENKNEEMTKLLESI